MTHASLKELLKFPLVSPIPLVPPKLHFIRRDAVVLDVYVPTIVEVFVVGAIVTWLVDRVLSRTGLYRFVWHPALFRASVLVSICGLLGLVVYG